MSKMPRVRCRRARTRALYATASITLGALMAAPPAAPQPGLFRFGVFEADARSRELRKNGVRLKLQQQPFQVLMELLRRPGEVVTREELRKALWPDDTFVDFDHGLNTAINKLRATLGDSGDNPRFIETLARRGYRFIAPVEFFHESGAAAPAPATSPAQGPAAAETASAGVVAGELPSPPRGIVRGLFTLIQVMYLCFYLAALWKFATVHNLLADYMGRATWGALGLLLFSALIGIATRLYLLAAALFDYHGLGRQFRRIFPLIVALDELWALAPLLLAAQIGMALALAAIAALLYLPFSQRTLIRMGYPGGQWAEAK